MDLARGVYIVRLILSDNEVCSLGSCRGTNFIVRLEPSDGSYGTTLANEIRSLWWGNTTVRIGGSSFDALPAGKSLLNVDAEGDWTVIFERQ